MDGHRRGVVVLGLALTCASLAFVRQRPPAAEPRPGPEAPAPQRPQAPAAEPTLVISASVASIDKLAAFAKDVGLDDVPFLSTTFVEQQLPFVGRGGLAGDRPLGALLYAGRALDLEDVVFVLPVNPGKASLKEFADKGALPIEGRADAVTLEGVGYRRSKDQFIFGALPEGVAAVPEDALASAYAGNDLLARVDVDVAAIERAAPGQYAQFFAALEAETRDDDDAREWEAVAKPLRAITRIGLSLARSEAGGLRVGLLTEPLALPQGPPGKFPRPGFPEGTLFRADLAYPPATALAPLVDAIELFSDGPDGGKATKEQQEQSRRVYAEMAKLLLNGEAGSLGIEVIDGHPVVYGVIRHRGRAPDPGGPMAVIAERQRAWVALDEGGVRSAPTHETYLTGEGVKIHRLIGSLGGESVLCLDAVRRDGAVLMALATTDGKYLEALLALKPEGETSGVLSGWLDLSAVAAAGLLPDGEEAGIGVTAMKDLKAAMAGQRLAWNVSPTERGARLDVDVPKALLHALATAAGLTP